MARGSVQKRIAATGKAAYRVRVEYDPDPSTGHRRQSSETFRTRKEADRRLAAWLSEIERGTAVRPDTMTVADLMAAWLADVAAHRVRETTRKGYEDTIRLHILPELGTIAVQRLTTARVQAFYSAKLAAGTGPRIVQLCHLRLSQALRQAVRWQIVPANVCDNVDPPTVRYKRGGTWDADQLGQFQDAARTDGLAPLWELLAMTGMRRGEALGLRWRDVDLERASVTVAQSIVASNGAPITQEPKTAAGRRTIRVLPSTVAALRAHRAAWLARKLAAPPELWQEHDLVICTATGSPINPNNVQRNFDRIVAAAGLPRIRVHDLRHSHASILLGNGVPVHVVSQRLGHANPAITLSVYAHVLGGMEDAAMDTLERLMGRRSS